MVISVGNRHGKMCKEGSKEERKKGEGTDFLKFITHYSLVNAYSNYLQLSYLYLYSKDSTESSR